MTVSAVILAGGAAQRMGRPKQLLPVDGQPMLLRVVDAVLAAGLTDVIVVLGASASAIAPLLTGRPLQIVANQEWQEGIASSLRCGLTCVSSTARAALFVPADLPRLTAAAIQVVVDHFTRTGHTIVAPTCNGQRGNPVLFARPLFGELMALRGDRGGSMLFAAHQADISYVETGDRGILLDIDTMDDYAQATG